MHKNLQFNKFECAGFKYENSFSKLQPQIKTQKDIFGVKLENLLFCSRSCILKKLRVCEGVCVKYDNSFLNFQLNNTQTSYFWTKMWSFFVLHETLHLGKLEGANLKYDKSFFKFSPKNAQIQSFLFARNNASWQIRDRWFKHGNRFFELLTLKILT